MNITRRSFIGGVGATGAALAFSGCECPLCKCGVNQGAKLALQLYSLNQYIGGYKDRNGKELVKGVGLAKALDEVAKIGFTGVEFAGYYNHTPAELKKMLDDSGLVACGTLANQSELSPANIRKTCEFNLAYGSHFICCGGSGNIPTGWDWGGNGKATKESDDYIKRLCDEYNQSAEIAKTYDCKIGSHNHMWDFKVKMLDGTRYFDYFFSHTSPLVQMEQDVGWTACAGFDPSEQFLKYPHRSYTLHAKENGMGSKTFDAILGQPGDGAVPVDWDKVINVAKADGVEWFIVECERHFDSFYAVKPSYDFLKSRGL